MVNFVCPPVATIVPLNAHCTVCIAKMISAVCVCLPFCVRRSQVPVWQVEGNHDRVLRSQAKRVVAYRGWGRLGRRGCNLMQSRRREAGGGRTHDDGNWADQPGLSTRHIAAIGSV